MTKLLPPEVTEMWSSTFRRRVGYLTYDARAASRDRGSGRTVGGVCGKRLKALLSILVPALERHGHLSLDLRVRELELTRLCRAMP